LACAGFLAGERELLAQAAAGTAFMYQGRLLDNGNPANATYDLQFGLYDSLGRRIGSFIILEDKPVTNGLFAVQLDFGSSPFAGDARFLGIGVRPWKSTSSFTTLTPPQELTPVPYALHAMNASGSGTGDGHSLDAVDGSPVDAVYVDADGKVRLDHGGLSVYDAVGQGIVLTSDSINFNEGTSEDPVYSYNSSGGMHRFYAQGALHLGISAAGVEAKTWDAAGYGIHGHNEALAGVAKAVYGSTNPNNQTAFGGWFEGHGYFERNLGIGVTQPVERLEVNGTAVMKDIRIDTDNNVQTYVLMCDDAEGNASWQPIPYDSPWRQGAGTSIYYDLGGVAIGGITDPATKLHIQGGNYQLGTDNGDLCIGNTSYEKLKIGVCTSGLDSGLSRINGFGITPELRLGVANQDIINIMEHKVGIEKTVPTSTLDVNGTVTMTGFKLTSSPGTGHVLTSDASGNGTWQPAEAGGLTLPADETVTSSSPALQITNSGTSQSSHAISARINAIGSADACAGYFSANGSGGHAIYAISDSGGATMYSYHSASSGHAIFATSNGNGGHFRSNLSGGYGIQGIADSTGDTTGGWFESAGSTGQGVYALSTGYYATGLKAEAQGDEATALSAVATGYSGVAASVVNNSAQPTLVVRNQGGGKLIRGRGGPGGTDEVFSVENDGRAVMSVLQITGGADLAENFDVGGEPEPGMVVMIDADRPGKLCIARGAYNRCVAGVISGANGVEAGMLLSNLPDDKVSQPVALSGRVWVHCDASEGAIGPGDLLTTSDVPGHAMKVTDYERAHGAVLGKAMTRLDEGRGLVLTLVNLQ